MGGFIDALQVRYGSIFIARSTAATGPFEVSMLTGDLQSGPYSTTPFMPITSRAILIEVILDKGMNTTFVYSTSNQVLACTPNQVCREWYTGAGVTGMACGIDCPTSLYVSARNNLLKLTDNGVAVTSSVIVSHATNINCLASVPAINTLLYRVGTVVRQISSTASKNSSYGAILTLAARTMSVCSLDISESNTQIILVESGVINTLETLQQPCEYRSTSQAISSSSPSACTACPPPTANAYLVVGSPTCQWQCYQGYTKVVSQCVPIIPPPCPSRYMSVDGLCVPSKMPWSPPGRFVSSTERSQRREITTGISTVILPIKMTTGGGLTFISTGQGLYTSSTFGESWQPLTADLPSGVHSLCEFSTSNRYNYLKFQDSLLFVGFTPLGTTSVYHCLWALNTTELVRTRTWTIKPSLVQFWSLSGQLCSVALGDRRVVYFLFCNTHYILQSSLDGERLTVFAGQTLPGYSDGDAQASQFDSPSSLAFYNQRLYVADKGN